MTLTQLIVIKSIVGTTLFILGGVVVAGTAIMVVYALYCIALAAMNKEY